MELLDALSDSVVLRPSGKLCILGQHIQKALGTNDEPLLLDLLRQPIGADIIARKLNKTDKYKIGPTSIKRHRAGNCGCFL